MREGERKNFNQICEALNTKKCSGHADYITGNSIAFELKCMNRRITSPNDLRVTARNARDGRGGRERKGGTEEERRAVKNRGGAGSRREEGSVYATRGSAGW